MAVARNDIPSEKILFQTSAKGINQARQMLGKSCGFAWLYS
jgi:hypothetical protein